LKIDVTHFPHFIEAITGILLYGAIIYFLGSIAIILKTKSIDRFEKLLWVISLFFIGFISMPLFWYIRIYKDKTYN
jgi:hypothetical protein